MSNMEIWIALIIIGSIYSLIVLFSATAWLLLKNQGSSTPATFPELSVIIAARNESANIKKCLEGLIKQTYPVSTFEVIIINDHSTDDTVKVVNDFILKNKAANFRIINNDKGRGKKAALKCGIETAKAEIIVTTDADCFMKKNWLDVLAKGFEAYNADMLLGPVSITGTNGLAGMLQSLEFMSLMGITGGSAALNMPVLANGANLAFKRSAFYEVNEYQSGSKYASGDDMFLLHEFKRRGKIIRFIKNAEAIVYTAGKSGINEFLQQRQRWAGKSFGYKDIATLIIAVIVLLTNLAIVAGTVSLFFAASTVLMPLIFLVGLKFAADFPIIAATSNFFKKASLLLLYPFAAIIYPWYVFITFLRIIFIKPRW